MPYLLPLFMALALLPGSLTALDIELLQPRHSPRVGDVMEWEIQVEDPAWLAKNVTDTPFMLISDNEGNTWNRPAFLYQEHRSDPDQRRGEFPPTADPALRIRHSPRQAGTLQWRLYAPGANPGNDQALASGQLPVLPGPADHGPITVFADNHRLFAIAEQTPFIPIGPNLAWALPHQQDRLATYIGYLDELQAVGGNHVRLWCSSWFAQIEGDQPGQWRLDQAWLLDQVLSAARGRNIRVTLVLDNHHDFNEGSNFPYGDSVSERGQRFFDSKLHPAYRDRLRYLVARYAHDDTIFSWELFNEIDLTGVERWRLQNWTAAAATFLNGLDPFSRLLSISWSVDDWPQMREIRHLDFWQIHRYVPPVEDLRPGEEDTLVTMLGDAMPLLNEDRPFLFTEVGHFASDDSNIKANNLDRDGLLLAHKAWAGLLLGGAGSGMNWWWDAWIDEFDLWHLYRPLSDTVARIDWRDADLRPMQVNLEGDFRIIGWQSPSQALLWPHSIHDGWHQRLVTKRPNPHLGRRFAVTLAKMTPQQRFAVTAIDMLHGRVTMNQEVLSNQEGQLRVHLPPYRSDQVLLIRRME